jgi:hypothetical protein
MNSIVEYFPYANGIIKRIKKIGPLVFLKELRLYYIRYRELPARMGFKPDLKYKLFVFYNYVKICYFIPDESTDYIMKFVPRRIQKYLLPITNPLDKKHILVNKIDFYRLLSSTTLPYPTTYFYTFNGKLMSLKGEVLDLEKLKLLEGKVLFSKIIDGSAALGAKKESFVIDDIDFFENRVFQEALTTHSNLLELSPTQALNCVKISTYYSQHNKVIVQLAFMKLGGMNSIVDNIGGSAGGGIAIPVDLETGKLKGVGYKEVGRTLRVYKIPQTGKEFNGFEVPYFHEAVNIAKQAHIECFKELRHIGWDIGITNNGPVIVEGNSGADMFAAQLFCRPFNYYEDPLIQENLIS